MNLRKRLDDLQNGYYIWQDPEGFCFGIDAVLLAHYARLRRHDKVLDMCSGNGVIPILMTKEAPEGVTITGLEIQDAPYALACDSVSYNRLDDVIAMTQGDIKEASRLFGDASFNVVTCNPPYRKVGCGKISIGETKAIARHEVLCTLEDVIAAASRVLKSSGRFYMVHLPERLQEICESMARHHLALKAMRFVCPTVGAEPTLVLLEAVKGGKMGLHAEAPLIVYDSCGRYTAEALAFYGDMAVPTA